MEIPNNARVVVCGYSESGKSCVARWIARAWLPFKRWAFISDPLDSWGGWGAPCYDMFGVNELVDRGERLVRLVSHDADDVRDLCELAACAPNSMFVLDESATLLPGDIKSCWPSFQRLVNHGRHHGQSVIVLGQYYTMIPPQLRNQAYCFCGNMIEGGGRKWLKERLGGKEPDPIAQFDWNVTGPDGSIEHFPRLTLSEIVRHEIRTDNLRGDPAIRVDGMYRSADREGPEGSRILPLYGFAAQRQSGSSGLRTG